MVRVENLGRRFGRRWVFRHLEFELQPGDCLVVLGANGSGKSTLLKIIGGLLHSSEGSVSHSNPNPLLRLGYASLDLATYPSLTGAEHLELAAKTRGLEDPRQELLAELGLEAAQHQMAGQYSTGMRARLKLALAIQARPDLLILDEPSASLDEEGRRHTDRMVRDQLRSGAVLIATNDPQDRQWANLEVQLG